MNVFDQKILRPEVMLTEDQFKALPKKKKVEYINALIQLKETNDKRNILTWFPDKGPFRRELYPKHMEFFEKGAQYKERLFMAANRCVTPWTYIETVDGPRLAGEVFFAEDAYVRSWDGESKCVAPISNGTLRGIEQAFRIVLDNGKFFDCSRKHRVLLASGEWRSVWDLMSDSSGLRWTQRLGDYQASCAGGGYLCDRQPQLGEDIAQVLLPRRGGVHTPSRLVFSREDAEERISLRTRVYQMFSPPSIHDDHLPLADLFSLFEAPRSYSAVLPKTAQHLRFCQLVRELAPALQSIRAGQHHQFFSDDAGQDESSGVADMPERLPWLRKGCQQSLEWYKNCQPFEELYHDTERIPMFFPFSHPELFGCRRIAAIVPIGLQPIIDATVEKVKCYYAGGVVHHNSGKSLAASYEVALHLAGMYPHWWPGYRFTKPIRCWVSSKTSSMTRDFVQRYLLGPWGKFGTGMIPGDCFTDKDWTPKRGIPEAIDSIRIHGTFGESEIGFKSFDQGWEAFQGTEMDLIWNDEECDELVHNECLTRLMTTKGIYMMTFTPLQGLTNVVRGYLGESLKVENKSKFAYVVNCGWDDVAHLSKEEKEHQWERTPPYLRDAKAKGLPAVGSGAIYPIPEEDLKISPFKIPDYWPRAFAMDVGWNRTAALWGALDRENDIVYLYSEYYRGQAEPSVHADGIRARGSWIPGVIDPASRGRNQKDGTQLFQIYQDLGLDIEKSKNAVEAGIAEVWQRMSSGRIKIFSTLQNLFTEIRMYHRDENGKIVKQDDHLLDCLKYLIISGLSRATTKSEIEREHTGQVNPYTAVDRVIGY
jgi:phage terminase large subunit-like protein